MSVRKVRDTILRVGYMLIIACGFWILAVSIYQLVFRQSAMPLPFYIVTLILGLLFLAAGRQALTGGKRRRFLAGFALLYFLFELILNWNAWSGNLDLFTPDVNAGYGTFNKPCAQYDPVRGFRWRDGNCRMIKIVNDSLLYDNTFNVNNAGFYSDFQYEFKKSDTTARRFIVFGDSFTAAEYLDRPWPDEVSRMFRNSGHSEVELLSFSINGGGLYNWYSIFFSEIIPQYEFDGIILAVFTNDLQRDFFVMEQTEEDGYTGYLDTIPGSYEDFVQNYRADLDHYAPFQDDNTLDSLILSSKRILTASKTYKPRPDLYGLSIIMMSPFIIYNSVKFNQFLAPYTVDTSYVVTEEDVLKSLGNAKNSMLDHMLRWCVENDKMVVITVLPYEPIVNKYPRKIMSVVAQSEYISKKYGADFINGCIPFYDMNKKELKEYFLPYDVHWNQKGSDLFSGYFYQELDSLLTGN